MTVQRQKVPIINLAVAPSERTVWGKPKVVVFAWAAVELLFVTNPLQISSKMRVSVLRVFGAKIGEGVIFRPRTRVKFPWKLAVGDSSWIGEGVWIHNQDQVRIGSNVVISQETFITTGSHAHRKDMALITAPVNIEDGTWIATRSLVTGGVTVGRSALAKPMTLVNKSVPENTVVGGNPLQSLGARFPDSAGGSV